jgi:hypothetical protein
MELTFEEVNPLYSDNIYDEKVDFNETFENVINPNTFSKDYSYFNNEIKNEIYNNGNISYDDILASLNVKVHNGALKFINNPNLTQNSSIYYPTTNNTCKKKQCAMKKVSFLEETQSQRQKQINKSFHQNTNLNPNNNLFQQYYKDYSYPDNNESNNESNNENNIPKQMSLEEIKQKRLENYINYHSEKQRIAQIKSKKLIIPGYKNGYRIGISKPNHKLNKMFGF